MSKSSDYGAVAAALDVPNYIDQTLLAAYSAVGDYPQYYFGQRMLPTQGPLRFFMWDIEDSWGGGSRRSGVNYDASDDPQFDRFDETLALGDLWRGTADFRQLFCDRAHAHFEATDGPLREPAIAAAWDTLNDFIEAPMLMEACLLYTSPSPRDQRGSRMPSSA